jgi:hypothetical protein
MPVSYTTTQYPIQKLLTWREKGKLRVPIHQRGFVWDNTRKINLIDTIMRSLPIPSLTLSVTIDAQSIKKYWIEDGQQRITTIQKYVNNEYVNKNRILFCNLSLPEQHQILNYMIPVLIYQDATQEERIEIFDRLQNGLALSTGERFNSLRLLSPTIQFTCDMLLYESATYRKIVKPFWGELLFNPLEETLKDGTKRFKTLKDAVCICTGALWGSDFFSDKYDSIRPVLIQTLTEERKQKGIQILLKLFSIFQSAMDVNTPTLDNALKLTKLNDTLWNPKKFIFYILFGLWNYPNEWDIIGQNWIDLIVQFRTTPGILNQKILDRTQKISGNDKWKAGHQAIMGIYDYSISINANNQNDSDEEND